MEDHTKDSAERRRLARSRIWSIDELASELRRDRECKIKEDFMALGDWS